MSVATTGLLETERSALEELERIEQAIADRISYNPAVLPPSHGLTSSSSLNGKRKRPTRDTVLHKHEISNMLDRYENQCKYIKQMEDPEMDLLKAKQQELDRMVGEKSFTSQYDQFKSQVAQILEYHRNYPNEPVENLEDLYKMKRTLRAERKKLAAQANADLDGGAEDEVMDTNVTTDRLLSAFSADLNVDAKFSGEEFYGRFVDLVTFHEQFLNLKFVQRKLSYIQYLDIFAEFENSLVYTTARLRDPQYFTYASQVHAYLKEYVKKTRPLEHPESTLAAFDKEFDNSWESGNLPSWIKSSTASDSNEGTSSSQEGVPAEDGSVWCSACTKKFKNLSVYNGHLNGNKHKKNVQAVQATQASTGQKSDTKIRALLYHEYCIKSIAEFISKQIQDTRANVERRLALTGQERQMEIQSLEAEIYGARNEESDDDSNDENESDSEDDVIYNPLKLPLGWDGKPIPVWLWKLNGLGIEFQCEICGNYTYMGRKSFEKHFMDARHQHGLKCLGIEPSLLFKGITSINDAVNLWEKKKRERRLQEGSKENVVEMEDEEGNVMSAKVYMDLKKQGLL